MKKPELLYRLRYKKTLEAPKKIVVWDVRNNKEYITSKFEMKGVNIKMKYGNSQKQEKVCGAMVILEVWG